MTKAEQNRYFAWRVLSKKCQRNLRNHILLF